MLTDLLQAVFSALSVGSIYALVAVGVTLVFAGTRIINFAQGEFVMLGGMIMVTLNGNWGWPLYAAIPATLVITALVAAALMKIAYRPEKNTSLITVLIITIGASLLISGGAYHIWDGDVHRFPPFSGEEPLHLAGAAIVPQALWVIGATTIIFFLLVTFFRYSIYGKAIMACSIDATAAGLIGIRVRTMVLASFILSGLLGCFVGILVTPMIMVDYSLGMLVAIKGFAAAMLGGMGSIVGAVLGGYIFSFLEAFSVTFISSSLKELVTFIVIILVLLFRPNGLLGPRIREGLDDEDIFGK
ncbi:MAG: branched-chain amino acid ABC transporter permease [Arenicellales bacterium]|jgi:branched-chain amino acid transport system permease protein|nr:branched-chain amino acid ABC transporter permease [Arenicellales bacterium]